MRPKKNSRTPNQRKKINSFQGALAFYHQTRPKLQELIQEAQEISLDFEGDQELIEKDQVPAPLTLEKRRQISHSEIERWLGTNLAYYSQSLENLLPHLDKKMDVVPKLLEGLIKEAQKGTISLSKLLRRLQKEIQKKTSSPSQKELEKIEQELSKRIHKMNFFKEEVDERFEDFKNTLIEYISNYCLLEHILTCSRILIDDPKSNVKIVVKRLTKFKEPL
jgi:hypothetical protein